MLVVLENNLSKAFRDHFNALARDPASNIELIPPSIGVFNADRQNATQEPFAELWFGDTPEDRKEKNILRAYQLEKMKSGEPVFVVQSTAGDSGKHFTQLLLTIRNLDRQGAKNIIAALPYSWGARQDRPEFPKEDRFSPSVAAEDVPYFLKAAGAKGAILQEMHSKASEKFYTQALGEANVIFISSTDILAGNLASHLDIDPALRVDGAPDGADKEEDAGQRRAVQFTQKARGVTEITEEQKLRWMFRLAKERETIKAGKTKSKVVPYGDNSHVAGMTCAIVDDIGDTCGTIIESSTVLVNQGASKIIVFLTHWTGDAGRLKDMMREKKPDGSFLIDRLTITDTCPSIDDDVESVEKDYSSIPDRITILRTAPLFAQAMQKFSL